MPWSDHAARIGSVVALPITSQPASAIILRGRESRSDNDSLILTDMYKRWLLHLSLCLSLGWPSRYQQSSALFPDLLEGWNVARLP